MSHPLRVRELKPDTLFLSDYLPVSHPLRVRELKRLNSEIWKSAAVSHPLRVRELKLLLLLSLPILNGRTLYGCVN